MDFNLITTERNRNGRKELRKTVTPTPPQLPHAILRVSAEMQRGWEVKMKRRVFGRNKMVEIIKKWKKIT